MNKSFFQFLNVISSDCIKKSYNEAAKLFELACMSGASAFTMPEELEEDVEKAHSEDYETMILNAIRRNDVKELKEGFIPLYGFDIAATTG